MIFILLNIHIYLILLFIFSHKFDFKNYDFLTLSVFNLFLSSSVFSPAWLNYLSDYALVGGHDKYFFAKFVKYGIVFENSCQYSKISVSGLKIDSLNNVL